MTTPIARRAPATGAPTGRHRLSVAACVLCALTQGVPARAETVTVVRIELAQPKAEKHVTLRFLRENRDFIREALDRTREKRVTKDIGATAIDPRFLAYNDMLVRVAAATDSTTIAEGERQQLDLLRSITQLGGLESELDQLDRLLAAQRDRLGILQRDFTGDQRTALAVVLSGYPQGLPLDQVALTLEDGSPLAISLTQDERQALQQGGAVQIFHGFVEPREQVVQIGVSGSGAPSGAAGYVTLDPPRDRLMLLRLDLSQVRADDGAAGIQATTWLNDARVP